MKLFYANLAEGMQKDVALRQAKVSFLKSTDKIRRDPFYWAGFVLIGDTAPVVSSMKWSTTLVIGVLALIAIMIVVMIVRKRAFKYA